MDISNVFSRWFLYIIIFIMIIAGIVPSILSMTSNIYKTDYKIGNFDGFILFTPRLSTESYLINKNGEIVHMWESNYIQAFGVYLLENGDLLRSDYPYFNQRFISGGVTGRVEKINWNGTLLWEFEYSNNNHCLHHDIEPLPNGNILMIAWEYKTRNEAINAGRDPNLLSDNQLWPDHIIEVKPTGLSSGDIVWEWHVWDHLIQDYDSTEENYGVVADHPELIDINFGGNKADWNHINSIDYNEEFDQILLSVRMFDEIWLIDHSTTTEEAAGHSGGKSGKGGDLLYRWGNPQAYKQGIAKDKKFFGQHDARWIEEGCPGEENILVFNNGIGRPDGKYSSVDEIEPPVDSNGNYSVIPGSAYGPKEQIWIYAADFFALTISGAQRISNGNTLICNGPFGEFFEISPEKEILWEYVNPYPNPLQNSVFKIEYIPLEEQTIGPNLDCEGSLNWINVKVGGTVNDSFKVQNIGDSGSLLSWKIESFPNWGTWSFSPESGVDLTPEDGQVTVQISVVVPDEKNKEFFGSLKIQNMENYTDFEIIPIYLKTSRKITIYFSFLDYLKDYLNLFPLLQKLLLL